MANTEDCCPGIHQLEPLWLDIATCNSSPSSCHIRLGEQGFLTSAQIWQTTFIACVVGWTMVRDWPWTHTVYFVLHGIIMLMKQHSYAFYNGHLSEISERRRFLLSKLGELESLASKAGPATAGTPTPQTQSTGAADQALPPAGAGGRLKRDEIDRISHIISSRDHISIEQSRAFERTLTREVEILTDELKGTASDPSKAYPANLGFVDHYKWIPLPTVVYEIEYPRSSSISWSYVAEKVVAMIGVLFVMVQISQYSMCM